MPSWSRPHQNTDSRRLFVITTSTTVFWVQLHEPLLSDLTNNVRLNFQPGFTWVRKNFLIVSKPENEERSMNRPNYYADKHTNLLI
jgi:hypothetical protein